MRSVRPARAVAIAFGAIALVGIAALGIAALTLASTAEVRPTYDVGRQTIYRLSYQGESVDQPSAVFGARAPRSHAQRVFTTISAVLTETVVAHDASATTLLLEIVQPKIAFSDQGSVTDALYENALASDLAQSYAVRLDSTGRIVRIASPAGTSSLGLGFVRTIAGAVTIAAPAHPSHMRTTWTAMEPDADGTRVGTYALDPWICDPLGTASVGFHRTTSVTARTPANDGIIRPIATTLGNDDGTWRLEGVLAALHANATRTVALGRDPIARSQTRIDITLVAVTALSTDRLAVAQSYARTRLASRTATTLEATHDEHRDTSASYVATLGAETEESLEGKLIRAARSDASAQRPVLVAQFAALFYEHPHAIADLAPIARSARPDSMVFGVLLPALEQAGTTPAQHALISLAGARGGEARAGRLVAIALGLEAMPIVQIDAALERVVCCGNRDAAQSAEFALGSIARNVRDARPDRATRIVARIVGRLGRARSVADRNTELLALGNAADSHTYPAIAQYVASDTAALRSAAATALRSIDDPAADGSLRTLLQDRDDFVRLAAATAFADRNASDASFDALVACARGDATAAVRSAAVTSVWNARLTHMQAADIVRSLADSDPDAGVRSAARNALASNVGADFQDLANEASAAH